MNKHEYKSIIQHMYIYCHIHVYLPTFSVDIERLDQQYAKTGNIVQIVQCMLYHLFSFHIFEYAIICACDYWIHANYNLFKFGMTVALLHEATGDIIPHDEQNQPKIESIYITNRVDSLNDISNVFNLWMTPFIVRSVELTSHNNAIHT